MPCEPALWFYVKKGAVGAIGTTSASFQATSMTNAWSLIAFRSWVCTYVKLAVSALRKKFAHPYIGEHVVFWKHDKFCGIQPKAATTSSLHLALTILLKLPAVFCVDAQTQGMFPSAIKKIPIA